MNNDIEIKPCPFCGGSPELPSGDGTQYEMDCDCGHASSSVQICDLMNHEERQGDDFINYRYAEKFIERAKKHCIENWNKRSYDS